MDSFGSYLIKHLSEEKADPKDFGSLDKNSKGVLHELMVGYHLSGGQHMDKHKDINGKSPKEVHDELTESLTPDQYKNFSDRAKKAADDILKEHNMSPSDVGNVQWTSKSGDIKRATGIDSSQSEDDSDVMLTHKNGTHHGLSLKVSDDSKPITLSNNGAKSTFGGDKIFENHKNGINQQYPELANLKDNPKVKQAAVERVMKKAAGKGKPISPDKVKLGADDLRKTWLETTPGAKEDLKKRTTTMLRSVVDNMHGELQKLSPQELSDHIRNSVLHAYKTPKEEFGHTHIRHFTGGGNDPVLETKRPGEDYEHYLSKPENLSVTKSGASINYHYYDDKTGKTIPFAMQTAKVGSQSDPMSNLVVIGKDVERKQDVADKARIKADYKKTKGTAVQPAPSTTAGRINPTVAPQAAKPLSSVRTANRPDPGGEDVAANEGMGGAIGSRGYNPVEHHMSSSVGGATFHTPAEQEMMKRGNG